MAVNIRLRPIIGRKQPRAAQVGTALIGALRDTVVEGTRWMATYPPKRGGRYKRTGTLKRSWSFKLSFGGAKATGVVGSSSSIAPYNRKVQGVIQTADFRRRGWRNVPQLAVKVEEDLQIKAQAAIDRLFL